MRTAERLAVDAQQTHSAAAEERFEPGGKALLEGKRVETLQDSPDGVMRRNAMRQFPDADATNLVWHSPTGQSPPAHRLRPARRTPRSRSRRSASAGN